MMTVRERITEIQVALRDGALTPDMTRDALLALTGLLGNVNDELREADVAYKVVLLSCLHVEKRANRAHIAAEISPEYAQALEAKDTATLVIEMIRSCRAYLRSLSDEMNLTR